MQYLKPEIREKILSSALAEFAEHGYARSQMRRIAQGAGISTSNIYRYFDGKEKIFAEIVRTVHQQISSLISQMRTSSEQSEKDVKSTAQQIAEGVMNIYLEYGRELLVIIDKSEGSKYTSFKETLLEMVCQPITSEIFSKPSEADLTVTYVIANGFVEGLFIIMRQDRDPQSMAAQINRLVSFYFDDLASRLA